MTRALEAQKQLLQEREAQLKDIQDRAWRSSLDIDLSKEKERIARDKKRLKKHYLDTLFRQWYNDSSESAT